jgi:hypothetical protein
LHQSIKSPFTVLDNFQRENPNQIFKTQEIAFLFLLHRKYKKERTPRRRRRSKEKYITGKEKKHQ